MLPSEAIEETAWQLSVDWVPVEDLPKLRFFPSALILHLVDLVDNGAGLPHYLGDVN
jgi:hypothetical protein